MPIKNINSFHRNVPKFSRETLWQKSQKLSKKLLKLGKNWLRKTELNIKKQRKEVSIILFDFEVVCYSSDDIFYKIKLFCL